MSAKPAEMPEVVSVERSKTLSEVEGRQAPPVVEPHLYMLMEMEAEAARWRRRSMFLLSILLHICLALILALSPELFQRDCNNVNSSNYPRTESTRLWQKDSFLGLAHQERSTLRRNWCPVVNPNMTFVLLRPLFCVS